MNEESTGGLSDVTVPGYWNCKKSWLVEVFLGEPWPDSVYVSPNCKKSVILSVRIM